MKEAKETLGLTKEPTKEPLLSDEKQQKGRRQVALNTVATSMRGILSENDSVPKRKKLLGE
jgi:hypothetical protein